MECRKCGSNKTKKNGSTKGIQRYFCKECGRTFVENPPKYGADIKRKALMMYLNNTGVRKTAFFTGASRQTILNWISAARESLTAILKDFKPDPSEKADVIEMDEIYTFVEKNSRGQSYGLLTLGTKSVLLRLK